MEFYVENLKALFKQWSGNWPGTVIPIPPSGSDRRYYRLGYQKISAIGTWNPVKEENSAFLYFSRHFHVHGLHVPAIYGANPENNIYLIEDLGNSSLFSLLEAKALDTDFPAEIERLYRESLKELLRFQIVAGNDLDYLYCYPHQSFDARSMKWDLQYFKYYFLKLHISFHEGKLEDDFDTLINYLAQADPDYFMFRDFQARNILIKDENKPYFIDYQGGRKGPLQYDVASLLFQVKADLPFELREELLDYYISELSNYIKTDKTAFKKLYYGFVLIRLLQVLGAYGFRGLIEKKPHFLTSIPFALKSLQWWLTHIDLQLDMPELLSGLEKLTRLEKYHTTIKPSAEIFTVSLKSFSYKHGIPDDFSGNGGGFVLDCRALPNPGREERYMAFNGKDQVIIDYFKDLPEVSSFLKNTEKLVSQSIINYLERGFKSLVINFGCTGGQHRSVYCTEMLAENLQKKYPQILVKTEHTMLKIEG